MSKLTIETVAQAAQQVGIPDDLRRQLQEMLADMTEPDADEPKAPAVKKQYVVLLSDPDGLMPQTDFAAWVLQIPEIESAATTADRIIRAAYDFNATKKGRLHPAKTIGEAIEAVPAKLLKGVEVWAKTKSPVLVVKTNNEIPDPRQQKLGLGDLKGTHA